MAIEKGPNGSERENEALSGSKKGSLIGRIRRFLGEGLKRKGEGKKEKETGRRVVELPRKKGKKVVVSNSSGEAVLGVVLGTMNGKYIVGYQEGDIVKFKKLSIEGMENNERMFNVDNYIDSVKNGPDYKFGDEVIIPRSNKQPSKAYIVGYAGGYYIVGFLDTQIINGVSGGRSVSFEVDRGPAYKLLPKKLLDPYNK